jgi:hypothetical protein
VSGFQVTQGAKAAALAGPLFVDPAFVAYQAQAQGKRLMTFTATDAEGRIAASLTLAAGADGVWSSPVTGAFGGLAAEPRAPAAAAFALAEAASGWLRDESATAQLRMAPDSFAAPLAAALENGLFRAGWRLAQTDLNFHLPVESAAAFRAGLGETKQKEIRRLQRSGAVFAVQPPEAGERAYRVIADNRAAQGYPMTMAWPQVAALAQAFPSRVSFVTVERGGEALAGAVCLRLTPDYAYVFYWGEAPAFRRESPVMLLAEGLVDSCAAEGVRILDLGTSTDGSVPNSGLIAFKEGLGCRTSAKRTYVLDPA